MLKKLGSLFQKKPNFSLSCDILTIQRIGMKKILLIYLSVLFLSACSASYEKLKKTDSKNPKNYSEYLFKAYKEKAVFEAEMMHDWNSAKLYSEKALLAKNGMEIFPEKIAYWKLPNEHVAEITQGYESLMSIYKKAKITDPYNLAIAISSLDCWSEQQEENWQTWDINECKDNFLKSLHAIYEKITLDEKINKENSNQITSIDNNQIDESVTLVTKNQNEEIMQIIYFDFDEANLSNVSINTLKNFIKKYSNTINKYIVIGHADTKGSKTYNQKLSIKRAVAIKEILINEGIDNNYISILGKGEESLAILTPDEVTHPANRRAEISHIK